MENTLNYINASLQNFSPIVEIEDKQAMAVGYLKEHGFDFGKDEVWRFVDFSSFGVIMTF